MTKPVVESVFSLRLWRSLLLAELSAFTINGNEENSDIIGFALGCDGVCF